MYRCALCTLVALLSIVVLTPGQAASPPVGVAIAEGGFQVDGNPVTGNATLFDGNSLETGDVPSELRLREGARMLLAADSRGTVYRDRLVLERGRGELSGGPGYQIEAHGLRISPEAPDAKVRVMLHGARQVQVASLAGAFRVSTNGGRVVAYLAPGGALEFDPQAPGKQAVFSMTGCLERRDGHYTLRDLVAGVVEEVRGRDLEKHVGDVVEVEATEMPNAKPVPGAEEVIQVLKIRHVSGGCPAPPAGAPPAPAKARPAPPSAPPAQPAAQPAPAGTPAPQAPAPSGGGMSGAKKAVIAGVLIGGAGAGAAVALTQKSKGSISR